MRPNVTKQTVANHVSIIQLCFGFENVWLSQLSKYKKAEKMKRKNSRSTFHHQHWKTNLFFKKWHAFDWSNFFLCDMREDNLNTADEILSCESYVWFILVTMLV